jgi:hypothetical protein
MTARPPSEHEPQPVPGYPPWVWWPGVAGWPYAKCPNGIDPPIVVRGRNWTALLAAIRKQEARRLR